jgi:hypothetical protein
VPNEIITKLTGSHFIFMTETKEETKRIETASNEAGK